VSKLVILNVTKGGVKDLLYLSFNIGAKRRSTKGRTPAFWYGKVSPAC
jgi:hypothetical protein